MTKRIITGAVYVAVLVGFFFLRAVDLRFFGILIYAFSLIGTWEIVHALGCRRICEDGAEREALISMSLSQKVTVYAYALLFTPSYYLVEYLASVRGFPGQGYRALLNLSFMFALVLLCLLVVDHKNSRLQGVGGAMLCGFYPTALLATMMLANSLRHGSLLALLLIFVISPVADTFAFVVGSIFKGKKLCPNISPKKTVSGAVGGAVFGTGATLLIYWIYTLCGGTLVLNFGAGWAGTNWLFLTAVGLFGSVLTEFGDLVESVIKRSCGIKDMGKILPGHGGVLDRIDGTLFASTFVYIMFALFV